MRAHLHRDTDLPVAENLDRLVLAHGALGDQILDGHRSTLREELAQGRNVHDLVLHPERVLEATKLREPHVERHLATLEAVRHLVASLRALGSATSSLALAGLTTTNAGLGGLGAGGWPQVVQL